MPLSSKTTIKLWKHLCSRNIPILWVHQPCFILCYWAWRKYLTLYPPSGMRSNPTSLCLFFVLNSALTLRWLCHLETLQSAIYYFWFDFSSLDLTPQRKKEQLDAVGIELCDFSIHYLYLCFQAFLLIIVSKRGSN